MDQDERDNDRDIALALRRLADTAVVPPVDVAREAALLAAFDAAQALSRSVPPSRGRQYWGMAGLGAAAAVMIAVGLSPAQTGRHGLSSDRDRLTHAPLVSSTRDVHSDRLPPNEFVAVPGAAMLPRMESGSLVRMNVPVSMLPSLGVMPPSGGATAVKADLIVGQDGLPRAVRLLY
jgi:hypothetical protein